MRVFVTGGSGFIGGRVIEALRRRGDEVAALARSDAAAQAVSKAGASPVRGDLGDARALTRAMQGIDFAVHAAADLRDSGPLAEIERVNVEGTANVLAAARAAGVRRLVHISTEAVLADGRPLRGVDETMPRPPSPVKPYGYTKARAEELVQLASHGGLETVVVRPRFVWGAGDRTLLPQLVEGARSGRLAWFDGGRYDTSTCHVDNAVEGILLAAERGRGGEIYFLTDGPPVQFRAFVGALLETQGVAAPARSVPRRLAAALAAAAEVAWRVLPLPGGPPLTRSVVAIVGQEMTVSDAKARRELGYEAHVSREEGLAQLRAPSGASAG